MLKSRFGPKDLRNLLAHSQILSSQETPTSQQIDKNQNIHQNQNLASATQSDRPTEPTELCSTPPTTGIRSFKVRLDFQTKQRERLSQSPTNIKKKSDEKSTDTVALSGSQVAQKDSTNIAFEQIANYDIVGAGGDQDAVLSGAYPQELISSITMSIQDSFAIPPPLFQELHDKRSAPSLQAQNRIELNRKRRAALFSELQNESVQNVAMPLEESLSNSWKRITPEDESTLLHSIRSKAFYQEHEEVVQMFQKMYDAQVERVEVKMKQLFSESQEQNKEELKQITFEIQQLKNDNKPLKEEWIERQQILLEKNYILSFPSTKTFYEHFLRLFSAKIITALTLTSGMVKREVSKTEKVTKGFGAICTGLLGGLPFVGGIASSLVGLGLDEGAEEAKKFFQKRKEKEIVNVVGDYESAMNFAENIARRLTQSYLRFILDKDVPTKQCKTAGKWLAQEMYSMLYSGVLDTQAKAEHTSQEDTIFILVECAHRRVHQLDLFFPGRKKKNVLLSPSEKEEHSKFSKQKKKKLTSQEQAELLSGKTRDLFVPVFQDELLRTPSPKGNRHNFDLQGFHASGGLQQNSPTTSPAQDQPQTSGNEFQEMKKQLEEQRNQIQVLEQALRQVLAQNRNN